MLCDTCVLKLIRVKTLSFVFGSITKRWYCHSLYFGGLNRCTRNAIIHTFSMSPVRLLITICRIFCRVYILIISYVYFLSSGIFSISYTKRNCLWIYTQRNTRKTFGTKIPRTIQQFYTYRSFTKY